MLSPYNGCSLFNFLIDHSELEASTDYLLCYTVQLIKPESGEQVLFSKAGGEWVALTPRATSKPSRHRPRLGLVGARGKQQREGQCRLPISCPANKARLAHLFSGSASLGAGSRVRTSRVQKLKASTPPGDRFVFVVV